MFELVITDPWCALQFASVNFCKRQDNDENMLVEGRLASVGSQQGRGKS